MLTLASGNVRFWSPGEGAGFPLFASPFVQFFYPLNLPLALYYRVAGGYSVVDHQTFTVLGIALFSLGLFLWLESLVPSRRSVLFATLLVGLSWKLGEILRFPNAVHTAAWIPWILYAVTAITRDPKHKKGRTRSSSAASCCSLQGTPITSTTASFSSFRGCCSYLRRGRGACSCRVSMCSTCGDYSSRW